jgi:predicted dithiol-disulfide oxidoreductase (DUF899 family)
MKKMTSHSGLVRSAAARRIRDKIRGARPIVPIWNILDMTPEGRGEDWHPKLDYAEGAK